MSYLRKDGRPNQVPLWYAYDDGTMRFSVATGSAKYHALARDPRVSVTIQDERPPYRAVIIEGTIEMLPHDPALSHAMAVRYLGKLGAGVFEQMEAEAAPGGRTTLALRPTEVKGFDNTRSIGRGLLAFARIRHRLPIPHSWL